MAMLGVAAFAFIHTATIYGVGSSGAYDEAGASFACRLCLLPSGRAAPLTSEQRAELSTRRLLLCAPDAQFDTTQDVQLDVVDAEENPVEGGRWNPEGQLQAAYGPLGTVEYRRVDVVQVL